MSDKFNLEDLVIAKMQKFPPWPGIIVKPPSFMPNKPAPKNGRESYCIFFFGTRNFSWCDLVTPYVKGGKIDVKKPSKSLLSAHMEIDNFIAKADDAEWRSAFLAQIQPEQLSGDESEVEMPEAKPVKEVTRARESLAVGKTKRLSDVKLPARAKSASPSRAGPSTEAEELATPKVFKRRKQPKDDDKKKSEIPLSGTKEKKEKSKAEEPATPVVKGPKRSRGSNKRKLETHLSDPTEEMEELDKKLKESKVEESPASKFVKRPMQSKSVDKKKLETPKSGLKEKNRKSDQKPKASTSREYDDAAEEDTNSGTKHIQISQMMHSLLDPTITPRELSPPLDFLTPTETLKKKNITPTDAKIGFIGLGLMGCGLVKNLLNSGHNVFIWNRTPDKADIFIQAGATYLPTPHDVAEAADVTFSCVSDIEAATKVVYGNCGVINAITSGKSFVEMTAMTPEYSENLSKEITKRGGRYLECGVEGGKIEAERGELFLTCSGDKNLYDEVKPCLDAFSTCHEYLGDSLGGASFFHTTSQTYAATEMSNIVEYLNTAKQRFSEADALEFAKCVFPSPLLRMKSENLISKTFPPHHVVKHVKKEVEKIVLFAEKNPVINQNAFNIVNGKLRQLMRSGHAEDDLSILYYTF